MIEVFELDKKLVALDPADADHINAAGRGAEGVVFPKKPPREQPLLKATRAANGTYEIKAGAVAGFMPLPSGDVLRVKPKIGSFEGVLWLLFHALKLDASLLRRLHSLPAERDNVIEWLLAILRLEVRKLVQAGLRKDYVAVEETSGYVRGRVLPARTIAETRGLAHRVTCLYDDFTADTFDNQVLRLALRAAAHHASDDIRHDLLGTDALFDGEVSFERADLGQAADKLQRLLDQKHAGRAAYVPAHSLALLILRLLSAGGDGRAWRQPGILLNMDKLFEDALRNMLKPLGKSNFNHGFRFQRNVRLTMNPDIPLAGLIVDAKYKRQPLHKRKTDREPELPLSGDIYQAYTYSSFGNRPCALVYAVGEKTDELARAKLAPPGCPQTNATGLPRVGLFSLDISGTSFDQLNSGRDQLIEQLELFKEGAL